MLSNMISGNSICREVKEYLEQFICVDFNITLERIWGTSDYNIIFSLPIRTKFDLDNVNNLIACNIAIDIGDKLEILIKNSKSYRELEKQNKELQDELNNRPFLNDTNDNVEVFL